MSIWVVASRKRGSGKTTIAMYINELLRGQGATLLIDANLEPYGYEWANLKNKQFSFEHLDILKQDGRSLDHRLELLKQQFAYIIVDIDGQDTSALRSVLEHADKLIIPSSINPEDIQLETELVQLAIGIAQYNTQLKIYTVLNKIPEQQQLAEMKQTQHLLKHMPGAQFLNTVIYEHQSYHHLLLNGERICEEQFDSEHDFYKMLQELMQPQASVISA
ncbi:hypothetical protein [Acinetobacter pseudolwoffii]|uniref:hypothetical protein n=1 Tax=Acinetobacter pseudolwoffii TaxID=2053287 RepID=UPI00209B81D7|nr:hypothetical protein [Acinetobacter pseudolwoffii]MCO8090900.1 hypothetical protein [Acinetobacter pseudolwoffii]